MGHIWTIISICCTLIIQVLLSNLYFYLIIRASPNTTREEGSKIPLREDIPIKRCRHASGFYLHPGAKALRTQIPSGDSWSRRSALTLKLRGEIATFTPITFLSRTDQESTGHRNSEATGTGSFQSAPAPGS